MNQGWGQPPGQYPQQPGYPQQYQQPGQFGPGQQYGGAPQPQGASSMATLALVLGLMSWVFGSVFTAIPAIILGKLELQKIERGESPAAGKQFAQIGFWSGLIHTILVVVGFAFFCIFYIVVIGIFAGAVATQPH